MIKLVTPRTAGIASCFTMCAITAWQTSSVSMGLLSAGCVLSGVALAFKKQFNHFSMQSLVASTLFAGSAMNFISTTQDVAAYNEESAQNVIFLETTELPIKTEGSEPIVLRLAIN